MLYPVLPIFLTQTLGASASVVGLVEGVAEARHNLAQGFSGWFSDKLQRRKPIALAGYLVAAVSKPLMGLSASWTGVLAARSLDRLGAGTRSAPRDALIAASADEAHRGKAFGLEGIGDNLGAFLGPLLAIALLGRGLLLTSTESSTDRPSTGTRTGTNHAHPEQTVNNRGPHPVHSPRRRVRRRSCSAARTRGRKPRAAFHGTAAAER
jgi:MFS family permease